MNGLVKILLVAAAVTATAAISISAPSSPTDKDQNGHTLAKLWKKYQDATDADLPLQQIKALEEIKSQALAQNIAWDFWDAADKYYDIQVQRNWKLRDSIGRVLRQEALDFGDPIVGFAYHKKHSRLSDAAAAYKFMTEHAEELSQGFNQQFYINDSQLQGMMSGHLTDYITNDYDYALWAIASTGYLQHEKKQAGKLLMERLDGIYPAAPYLMYCMAEWNYSRSESWRKGLQEVIDKYPGKAITMYPKESMIVERFREMDYEDSTTSEQFKALRSDAVELERQRTGFSGSEEDIVSNISSFKYIINTLDEKSISASVSPDKVTVRLRNTSSFKVSLSRENDDKVLYSKNLTNKIKSYYKKDIMEVDLPDVGDGKFRVNIESLDSQSDKGDRIYGEDLSQEYTRYSYALALRWNSDGLGIFASNASTGMPLKRYTLVLAKDGKEVASAAITPSADGYTPMPPINGISPGDIEDYTLYVCSRDASGLERRSPDVNYFRRDSERTSYGGCIFLNSAAFHSGGKIEYKVLAYSQSYDGKKSLLKSGEKVEVIITDAKYHRVHQQEHLLSALGSAAGEFVVPEISRNGRWAITLHYDGHLLSHKNIYCGEFVPPTFECEFEKHEEAIFPGDNVTVRGKLSSFSGHNLSDAAIKYHVMADTLEKSGKLSTDSEGYFQIDFTAEEGDNTVTITVTDATGQTREFEENFWVDDIASFTVSIKNSADPSYHFSTGGDVVTSSQATFEIDLDNAGRKVIGAPYFYAILDNYEKVLLSGKAVTGKPLDIDLSTIADGQYSLGVYSKETYENYEDDDNSTHIRFIKYTPGAKVPEGMWFYRCGETLLAKGQDINFSIGSGDKPLWAVVELYASGRKLLYSKIISTLKGKPKNVSIPYPDSYPGNVALSVLFINDYRKYTFTEQFYKAQEDIDLPVEVVSLPDKASPSEEITLELDSKQGSEIAVAVWDSSSDLICKNTWDKVFLATSNVVVPGVYISVESPQGKTYDRYNDIVYGYGYSLRGMSKTNSAEAADMVFEEAAKPELPEDIAIREDFQDVLYFEPFATPDENGRVKLHFKASDKLSTYKVAIFAHDKNLRNKLITKEIQITIPVKVDVLKPEYLLRGDSFSLTATVASMENKPMEGTMGVYQYDTPDYKNAKPLSAKETAATLTPHGVFKTMVPVIIPENSDNITVIVTFKAGGASDAMLFNIPVLERNQVLTESHSAVLLSGEDKENLIADLRTRFTGTTSVGAEYKEVSVREMVQQTLEEKHTEPSVDNLMSLTEAIYVIKALQRMNAYSGDEAAVDSLVSKVIEFQNTDGGFCWFKGFRSSPILTATVLERFSAMRLPIEEELNKAVKYLDDNQLSGATKIAWCGGLSDEQYMYIRAMYANVPFAAPPKNNKEQTEAFKQFKKDAKAYLTPGKVRGLGGYIMAKARRLATLKLLCASTEGKALAKAWGIKTSAKIEKSAKADIASLLEYAVRHKDGGWYYPNAVMPWRGLLESEAYAHSLLANLLDGEDVADGIRLYLMLQKETQHWDLTPHFVDAIECILSAKAEILETKVLILTKTYRKPLEELKAAGNGFTISREFFKEDASGDSRIAVQPGDTVFKGEKIIAVYHVYNAENRSFVRIRAPREATLRPVNQLSGHMGWRVRPLLVGSYRFTPQGYRDVHTSYTDYFFDSLSEENHEFTEEFYVTQTGTFACGVPEVESLYAPHYRANGAFTGTLHAE